MSLVLMHNLLVLLFPHILLGQIMQSILFSKVEEDSVLVVILFLLVKLCDGLRQ